MSLPNRLLVYLFPAPLWLVAYRLRLAAGEGHRAAEFFTPSLAATAIGLCLPVCIPKIFATEKLEEMSGVRLPRGYVVRTTFDSNLVPFGWMAVGAAFAVWACALFVSIGGRSEMLQELFEVPRGRWVALIICLVAMLLTEFKERA